jgi:hypothetical protein
MSAGITDRDGRLREGGLTHTAETMFYRSKAAFKRNAIAELCRVKAATSATR